MNKAIQVVGQGFDVVGEACNGYEAVELTFDETTSRIRCQNELNVSRSFSGAVHGCADTVESCRYWCVDVIQRDGIRPDFDFGSAARRQKVRAGERGLRSSGVRRGCGVVRTSDPGRPAPAPGLF